MGRNINRVVLERQREHNVAKTIMIVDDSKTIRQQVSFTLTKGGYEVIEAEDGAEGEAVLAEPAFHAASLVIWP